MNPSQNTPTTVDVYAENPLLTNAYVTAIVTAAGNGAALQGRLHGEGHPWINIPNDANRPRWNWDCYDYRVSPDSRLKRIVARHRDDYPALFWVRVKAHPDTHCLCTGINLGWLYFSTTLPGIGNFTTFEVLSGIDVKDPRPCEYCFDRHTWHPCTKEVRDDV